MTEAAPAGARNLELMRGSLSPVLIGVHVRGATPLEEAREAGADVLQMFVGNPQSFEKPPERPDADALLSGGVPIFVHAPYRLNVCHPSPRVRVPSRKTLAQTAEAAAKIGAAGVIVHGGHSEDGPGEGPMRWWKVFEERSFPVPILIENTAGGENAVARSVDQLSRLWEKLQGFDVGFCLDTCHAHASGEDLAGFVEKCLAVVGTIDLVHANSSRDKAGSGADRHANVVNGQMDPEVILDMVRASGSPAAIFETPWPGILEDVAWLRQNL